MEPKRLNKFISDAGICSRREADKLIEQGRVTVNGKFPDAGTKVTPKDKVRVDDQLVNVREEETVFLVFNKPAGISVKTDPSVKDNIIRAINYPASIQPIGHLERDAEGLIFLSNDSDMVRKMARADNKYEKEYLVTVDKLISSDFLAKLSGSDSPETEEARKKTFVSKEGSTRFRIVLEPNSDHHIKRRCEDLGYQVVHLQRTRVANITLAKLPTGYWRTLTAPEIDALKRVASDKSGKAAAEREKKPFKASTSKPKTFDKKFSKEGAKPADKRGTASSTRNTSKGASKSGAPAKNSKGRSQTSKGSSKKFR